MGVNRVILLGLASASLLLAPTAAPAQNTGTRIGQNAKVKDVAKLTRLLAECVADRRPAMVRTWLKELPGTASEAAYIKRQEGDLAICLEDKHLVFAGAREMVYTPKSLRYPVALAYARQSLRKTGAAPVGLNPDSTPWFMAPLAALPAGTRIDKTALAFQDFGHCVASMNWQGSRTLLLSEPDSPAEGAAVKALVPVLGPCLDANAKLQLTPHNLRVALAEPMVQILMASGNQGG